ncbi:coiled-coil domain-containing protein 113 isoform X1 [Gallus gallus]|uniref:coiled-coil domain-containing protein 113 isoform X1 n=1 Tax=Gallus gallus TaxID=9031 RepID=UPI001AE2781E|nr:coiled-coil domain-containing protein 113 isoform X1 [Gallus gallus]XP_040501906.1 coiled-coil domain-containing protein 113 isoform X1 [Gallus gallus]
MSTSGSHCEEPVGCVPAVCRLTEGLPCRLRIRAGTAFLGCLRQARPDTVAQRRQRTQHRNNATALCTPPPGEPSARREQSGGSSKIQTTVQRPNIRRRKTRGRSRSRLRSSSSAYFAALTVEQKCELAEREMLDVKSDIQKMEEDSVKTLHDLEAVIQEADAWWADVKKVVSDFEEDIVRTISNKKGSITASEKLLRYLEEKNHQRDLMRQKLRLESNLLRSYKKKLQQQLRQKEHVGEVFHEVHAELLQVKKAQCEEEIDEKNKELQQLKLALEKIQVINFWKKKLHNAMETSTVLMKDISQRKEMLEKIEINTTLVKEQQAKEESLIGWLQKQLSDYSTPPVMSYMQTVMAVADLEKSIKAWERRVAIAEMTLQSYHRAWNQVRMSGNLHLPCVMLHGKQ